MRGRRKETITKSYEESTHTQNIDFSSIAVGSLALNETEEFPVPALALKDINCDDFYAIANHVEEGNAFFVTLFYSDIANGRVYTSQEFVDTQKMHRAMCSLEKNPREFGIGTLVLRENSKGRNVVEVIITDGNHRAAISLLNRNPIRILIANTWNLRDNTNSVNPNDSQIILGFNHIVKQVRRLLDYE